MRALRYYLDCNHDLKSTRSLLFISFKNGHTSDNRLATFSSYPLPENQQTLDLVQVKAHDIRAFAVALLQWGFDGQIMQACHWKAHNTITKCYQKDLTWSDNNNNMYLGPLVGAQQILDSSLTGHPWGGKKSSRSIRYSGYLLRIYIRYNGYLIRISGKVKFPFSF